jgi:hypothetical protein
VVEQLLEVLPVQREHFDIVPRRRCAGYLRGSRSRRSRLLLSAALREGNEKVIKVIRAYILLRSLGGIPGTFTKMGLTGLPLATLALTIFLVVVGLYNDKLLDLAQLSLGAFIGSYVQKRGEVIENQTRATA